MLPKLYLLLTFLCFSFLSNGQNLLGEIEEINHLPNHEFLIKTNRADLKIAFYGPDILRIRYANDDQFAVKDSIMLAPNQPKAIEVLVRKVKKNYLFESNSLTLKLHRETGQITIENKEGKVLVQDHLPASKQETGLKLSKVLQADEHFFGFGERMDVLDRRGRKVKLEVGRGTGRPHIVGAYNVLEANYSPIPFFMSTKGYGLYLHNSYTSEFDMGQSSGQVYTVSAQGGEMDYYVFNGPSFAEILDHYTAITGKSPLLPLPAFGLQVGTYNGGTWGHENELTAHYPIALIKKFRAYEIPVDVLHFDSTWRIFGKSGGSGATSFEWRPQFTNPKQTIDSLYALHLNMVGLHVRPRLDNGFSLDLLDQARKAGMVYPEPGGKGEFVNFFDPKAADWWWENGAMRVANLGIKFFKTDEGSAFGRLANESDKTGPTGEKIKELHNLFPLVYAKAPFEHFAKFNGMRGMNHTREGFAGIQRYPFIFAGDWPSEWQYFEPVIKAGLNIGLSGVGYWTHCMGGFEHVADPELYIRWCQFGLFSPLSHLFGMEHPNYKEPWNYGMEAVNIFRKYTQIRYELLPYIYSSAYQMYQSGTPLMRALVFHFQDDPNVYPITDQYMFGENLMICPVTTKGAQTRVVYLPEGQWLDLWTSKVYSGKQHINILSPLDIMPIFLKAGGLLPSQEVEQYIGQKDIKTLNVKVFPAKSGQFELYEDDGKSMQYQSGDFAKSWLKCERTDREIVLSKSSPTGRYPSKFQHLNWEIFLQNKPSALLINGKQVAIGQSEEEPAFYKNEILYIKAKLKEDLSQEIRIQ
ncbi:DUF4968 domain-containing protein [Marinilongibacter aquaticus]|uniref:glycoside hydrolase family 31 protein n=1 Tax=Marinilongibacter aquaticus TaxID=2975157 RepID=UPI0021BD3D15|nr:TIM-barrel domain-containing protein [Marinilongibacter aquaticus]UBM58348.1 DUF4968 domain-containing protein [Marinilongibacter aquaticus]